LFTYMYSVCGTYEAHILYLDIGNGTKECVDIYNGTWLKRGTD